ncbi:MAG: hypothetical protein QE271_12560 [Bacteriovoracaceae bacterium]|nr:hypothetical protein [Bacteriovoracaceae bacterium]
MKVLFFISIFISYFANAVEIPEKDLNQIIGQSASINSELDAINYLCTCWQKDRNGRDFAASATRPSESDAYAAACDRASTQCYSIGAGGCSQQSSKRKCWTVGF